MQIGSWEVYPPKDGKGEIEVVVADVVAEEKQFFRWALEGLAMRRDEMSGLLRDVSGISRSSRPQWLGPAVPDALWESSAHGVPAVTA